MMRRPINEIIDDLRRRPLTPGQRKNLNAAVRCMRQRRPGGARLHHPSHYLPQIVALAEKIGVPITKGDPTL